MQDFTKQVATSSDKANSALLEQNNQIPKILLSKDRLWNLVFWLGISSGLALATFTKFTLKMPTIFLIIVCSVLLGVPLVVTLANRTRFITKDTFANSEGKILTQEQIPTGHLIWLTILGVALTFALSDKYAGRQVISSFFLFTGLLSGFSLYFIFKNCPISILFNYKFWGWKARHNALLFNSTAIPHRSSSTNNRSPAFPKSSDYIYNPAYRSSISNIYHKR